MNQSVNESLIHCKNCEGYYDSALTECPYCHVSTEDNLTEVPVAAAPSVADYAGGFGEPGSTISRVATAIAILLLLLAIGVLIWLGGSFLTQFTDLNTPAAPAESSVSEPADESTSSSASSSSGEVSEEQEPEVVVLSSITLDTNDITLAEGEVYQLVATVHPSDWEGELTWSSDNKKIASVDEEGRLTNVNGGDCVITVSADGVSTTCKVHCDGLTAAEKKAKKEEEKKRQEEEKKKAEEEKKRQEEEEEKRRKEEQERVESAATAGGLKLTLGGKVYEGNDFTLTHVGESYSFEVSGGDGNYKWSSSNSGVASVSGGKVTATGVGTANITCTSGDGKSVTAIIRVSSN